MKQKRSKISATFSSLNFSRLKRSQKSIPALWTVIASMLFLAAAQPGAYGLEFPMTSRLVLADSKNLTIAKTATGQASLASEMAEMALVADISQQVELARTLDGAKKVAKTLMSTELGWGDDQYSCLNRLWTRESHWNYKAHNYRSGAHGIAQALPAIKMEIISSDWRTNPVTQIRWGLHYINLRYDTPCQAWSKFKRSRYY